MALEFEKELTATSTNIPGMLVFDLPVHGDSRGWFKENWQREKMRALGLPDMGPVSYTHLDVYKRQLSACAERYGKSEYGRHLKRVAAGEFVNQSAQY